ncbi:MAG: TfoX/Sxy family protein [Haliangiales bacterium]
MARKARPAKPPTYDQGLVEKIRVALGPRPEIVERKMFGGIAFLVNGHMACGVNKRDLMVRVGPDGYQDALAQPHARPMDFTGKPLKGFVYVDVENLDAETLSAWVMRGFDFASSLPPK